MVDFYPSISLDLLNDALDFAANYANITDDERHIITHTKKSCLFGSGEQWCKKSSFNFFDITMGSYEGAETCELIGCFLLHQVTTKHGNNLGPYRDDDLGISNKSPREVQLIKIFRKHGLKITIKANKKCVDFLDVTLNLSNGKHMPRAVARTLIVGVHIHAFMFCLTSFFSNQIQISQFEKKPVRKNMNI